MQRLGDAWFEALLAQNPRWVRGTNTPTALIKRANATEALTFTSYANILRTAATATSAVQMTLPLPGPFVSWPQTGGILKDAPHPEGAKLLSNWFLSPEMQAAQDFSVRTDLPVPAGNAWGDVWCLNNTDPAGFLPWMEYRPAVERVRLILRNAAGHAAGAELVDRRHLRRTRPKGGREAGGVSGRGRGIIQPGSFPFVWRLPGTVGP